MRWNYNIKRGFTRTTLLALVSVGAISLYLGLHSAKRNGANNTVKQKQIVSKVNVPISSLPQDTDAGARPIITLVTDSPDSETAIYTNTSASSVTNQIAAQRTASFQTASRQQPKNGIDSTTPASGSASASSTQVLPNGNQSVTRVKPLNQPQPRPASLGKGTPPIAQPPARNTVKTEMPN
jgi:hypothetical protein